VPIFRQLACERGAEKSRSAGNDDLHAASIPGRPGVVGARDAGLTALPG
jgi:hypothetical protein